MIEIEGLSKRYSDTGVVDDATFTVRPGIVACLLGPKNAGKTTLLRMIAGLEAPSSGAVRLAGRCWEGSAAPLSVVASTIDVPSLRPMLTVRENLVAHAERHGIPRRRADAVLDAMHMRAQAARFAGTLDRGQRRELDVAFALLADPQILVLDEPITRDHPEVARRLSAVIASLAARGKTILVSTEDPYVAEQIADQLITIEHGVIVTDALVVEFERPSSPELTTVRSTDDVRLARLLADAGVPTWSRSGLSFTDIPVESVAWLAASEGIELTSVRRAGPRHARVHFERVAQPA